MELKRKKRGTQGGNEFLHDLLEKLYSLESAVSLARTFVGARKRSRRAHASDELLSRTRCAKIVV